MDDILSSLAQVLVDLRLLSQKTALQLQQHATKRGERFITHVIDCNVLSAKTIAITLADHFNLSYLDFNDPVARQAFKPCNIPKLIHTNLLKMHHILPLGAHQQELYVAMDDPSNLIARHDIQFHTGMQVIPFVVEATVLTQQLHVYFNQSEQNELAQYAVDTTHLASSELLSVSADDDLPVVRLVHRLIHQAIEQKASDIHFEPYVESYRVRFRLDGLLADITTPHTLLASRITACIKIMADMDVSERRLPQDGRFTFKHQAFSIDCRVSSCPTLHGEKLVIRLLHHNHLQPLSLEHLNLSKRDKTCVIQAITRSQGLVLVTGPTGSGKSTTLYAALNHINTGDKNILTVEDPIEMQCSGINQIQVNHKIDLNFSRVLRSFLRQDPDVIMVGEIRDLETAEIALKASQTGHLVLSTLHTNSAVETLIRLMHLGLPAFQIMNSLSLVVAQRLLRKLCSYCKTIHQDYALDTLLTLGYSEKIATSATFYKAQGCTQCIQGYRSRLAIFEVMPMTPAINQLMMHREVNPHMLATKAKEEGMLTLYQAGLMQAATGVTSIEEVHRVTL